MSQARVIKEKVSENIQSINILSTEQLLNAWQKVTNQSVSDLMKSVRFASNFAAAALDSITVMKVTKDHVLLFVADLAALLAYVYVEYINITKNIDELVHNITLQSNYGFFLLPIIIPFIHGISSIPQKKLTPKYVNYLFVFTFIFLFLCNFLFDFWLESKVVSAGYTYCEPMSKSMRMTDFNVYLRDGVTCLKQ